MEQDPTWNITWPATSVGDTAVQKCPGGGEVEGIQFIWYKLILSAYAVHFTGLAARKCVGIDKWTDPDVLNCITIEQIRLRSQIKNVEHIVDNILSNNTRDLTERFDSQLIVKIAGELNIATNTLIPLFPNDVIQTVNTLKSIVK